MTDYTSADVAFAIWEKYQHALTSGKFKSNSHLNFIRDQEEYHRNRYLSLTAANDPLPADIFGTNDNNQIIIGPTPT